MTQAEISKGIMSQSNYSKVEKNEIDIPFSKMISLLHRLNMNVDEFIYIHRDYKKNAINHFNPLTKVQTGDKELVIRYIEEYKEKEHLSLREEEVLAIFEALLLILENHYNEAQEKVMTIWERLKNHDTWYLYDIELINAILYVFPLKTAESIVEIAIHRLEKYKNFKNINPLISNLQLNLVLMQINNKAYHRALLTVNNLITFCKERNYHTRLAVCYARKGMILENLKLGKPSVWYEKCFTFLEYTNNTRLVEELKSERYHALK